MYFLILISRVTKGDPAVVYFTRQFLLVGAFNVNGSSQRVSDIQFQQFDS
jgi:hypothetical protein